MIVKEMKKLKKMQKKVWIQLRIENKIQIRNY